MNVALIPDYIAPIVGCRIWNLHANGLRSLNGVAWLPGSPFTATCRRDHHEAPVYGCSCGIYAAKDYRHLGQMVQFKGYPHGEVYLWGKIVVHRHGYRAQFAYPKNLVLPSTVNPRWAPSALEPLIAYKVDISVVANSSREEGGLRVHERANKRLWANSSGYTPFGCDWLAERQTLWCAPCEKWHRRVFKIPQLGDSVMVLGRGIGLVERDNGLLGNDSVCVRLGNDGLFIVPFDEMVWDCQYSRWEVDLNRSAGRVIVPSPKGSWKIFGRPLKLPKFFASIRTNRPLFNNTAMNKVP